VVLESVGPFVQANAVQTARRVPAGFPYDPSRFVLMFGCRSAGDDRRKGGDFMKSLAKSVRRFLVSEDGPTAVEYAVMLALIVIVCLTAISSLGTAAKNAFYQIKNSVAAAAPS
jgi:pilus assembly protein Flp/PilA